MQIVTVDRDLAIQRVSFDAKNHKPQYYQPGKRRHEDLALLRRYMNSCTQTPEKTVPERVLSTSS
eukprot:6477772-Amphidinium_carterae.1